MANAPAHRPDDEPLTDDDVTAIGKVLKSSGISSEGSRPRLPEMPAALAFHKLTLSFGS